MIDIKVTGELDVSLKLDGLTDRLRAELYTSMLKTMFDLQEYVKSEKLSGQVLNRRTGTLSRSFTSRVTKGEESIVGEMGPNTPYALIQEYGGTTSPHVIEAKYKKALAFSGGYAKFDFGQTTVFARRVNHPGSKIPERSYMRTSLAENLDTIRDELKAASQRAISA